MFTKISQPFCLSAEYTLDLHMHHPHVKYQHRQFYDKNPEGAVYKTAHVYNLHVYTIVSIKMEIEHLHQQNFG